MRKEGKLMNQTSQSLKRPWTRKIHELIRIIHSKDLKKVYDKTSPHHGSTYYRLNVALENNPKDKIYVYQSYLEKESVWKDILESNYIDQRYLFYCIKSRKTGNFILNNWKELANSFSERRKVLKPKEAARE